MEQSSPSAPSPQQNANPANEGAIDAQGGEPLPGIPTDGEAIAINLAIADTGDQLADNVNDACAVEGETLPPLQVASLGYVNFTGATEQDDDPGKVGPKTSGYFQDTPRFHFELQTMELADPHGEFGPDRHADPTIVRVYG